MDLTCIRCPMGCAIHVEMENGQVVSVTGNTCPRGAEYAKSEATAPVRTVTSTVRALGGVRPVVAVNTVPDVPKGKIFAVMDAVRALEVKTPVHIGDILCENIADTGSRQNGRACRLQFTDSKPFRQLEQFAFNLFI